MTAGLAFVQWSEAEKSLEVLSFQSARYIAS